MDSFYELLERCAALKLTVRRDIARGIRFVQIDVDETESGEIVSRRLEYGLSPDKGAKSLTVQRAASEILDSLGKTREELESEMRGSWGEYMQDEATRQWESEKEKEDG